jgi:hypothetical protein
MTPTSSDTTTPTWTLVFTGTPTPTASYTPTPIGDCGILKVSAAYPNPVMKGEFVKVDLYSDCPKTVRMTIYTVANRKVYEREMDVMRKTSAVWDLRDTKGAWVANGNYYIRFTGTKGLVPVAVMR